MRCHKLVVVKGEGVGAEYMLEDGELLIGRSRDCDVILKTGKVSRKHAHLIISGDACSLRSLGKAGTLVDGSVVQDEIILKTGQHIEVPGAVFRYETTQDNAADVVSQPQPSVASESRVASGSTSGGNAESRGAERVGQETRALTDDGLKSSGGDGTILLGGQTTFLDDQEIKFMIAREEGMRRARRVALAAGIMVAFLAVFMVAEVRRREGGPITPESVKRYDAPDGSFSIHLSEKLRDGLNAVKGSASVIETAATIGAGAKGWMKVVVIRDRKGTYLGMDLNRLLREALPRLRGGAECSLRGEYGAELLPPNRIVPALTYEFSVSEQDGAFLIGKGLIWRSGPRLFAIELSCNAEEKSRLTDEMSAALKSCAIRDRDLERKFFPAPKDIHPSDELERRQIAKRAAQQAAAAENSLIAAGKYPQKLVEAENAIILALQDAVTCGQDVEKDMPEWLNVLAEIRGKRIRAYYDCEFRIDQAIVMGRFRHARDAAEYGLTLFPEEKSWYRLRLLEKTDDIDRKLKQ